MNDDGTTDTFSIVLLPEEKTTKLIQAARKLLPPAPLRDDTPHVTVLRTIKTPVNMSDEKLLQDVERLLRLDEHLPLAATIKKSANIPSPLFGISSQLQLTPSTELKELFKQSKRSLKANDYTIGLVARLLFLPHISVRLGVPYTEQAKKAIDHNFPPGTTVTFTKWAILKDVKKDGKYLVKELIP